MSEPEPKKRVGRPPKALGKRQSYAFRMNEPIRAIIAEAAEMGGRSLSEEIEKRIMESANEADYLKKFFGGTGTLNLVMLIATAIRMATIKTGKSWENDRDTRFIVAQAIVNFGYLYGPSANDDLSDDLAKFISENSQQVSRDALKLLSAPLSVVEKTLDASNADRNAQEVRINRPV